MLSASRHWLLALLPLSLAVAARARSRSPRAGRRLGASLTRAGCRQRRAPWPSAPRRPPPPAALRRRRTGGMPPQFAPCEPPAPRSPQCWGPRPGRSDAGMSRHSARCLVPPSTYTLPTPQCCMLSGREGPSTIAQKPNRHADRLPSSAPRRVAGVARWSAGCAPACDEIAKHGLISSHEPCTIWRRLVRHVTQYASYTLKGMNS